MPRLERKSRLPRILVAATFLVCFPLALWSRISGDFNYNQLHLRIPPELDLPQTQVLFRNLQGQLRSATRNEENSRVFSLLGKVEPITELRVISASNTPPTPQTLLLKAGTSWSPPSTRLPLVQEAEPISIASQNAHNGVPAEESEISTGFTCDPGIFSRLPGIPAAINWQGDRWLLMVPFLQAVICSWLTHVICLLLQLNLPARPGMLPAAQLKPQPTWIAVVAMAIKLFVCLLILQQLFVPLRDFWFVRSGVQFAVAIFLIAIIFGSGWLYVRAVRAAASDRRRIILATVALLTLLALKLAWVLAIDSSLTGDYEKYRRYGIALATGKTELIGDQYWATRYIYLQRALFTSAPVAAIFGTGILPLEIANVLMQVTTCIAVGWLTTRFFNLTAGCIAAPLLATYPAFWYSPTLATPQIPGFLSICLLWIAVEKLRCLLQSLSTARLTVPYALHWALLTLAIATFTALTELQKTYGQFVLLAAVASVTAGFLLTGLKLRSISSPQSLRLAFLALATLFFTYQTMHRSTVAVKNWITSRTGPAQTTFLLDSISAVESTSDGSGESISLWRFAYLPQVPESWKTELLLRRTLLEKISAGSELLLCALRKNAAIGRHELQDHMTKIWGGRSGLKEAFEEALRVPWWWTQYRVSVAVQSVLLLLSLTRVCLPGLTRVSPAELFPMTFVLCIYLFILFFHESGPYYGQILAFPLCWSSAAVLAADVSRPAASSPLTPHLRTAGTAVAATTALIILHSMLGTLLEKTNPPFLRTSVASHDITQTPSSYALSTDHRAVLALKPFAGIYPGGAHGEATFLIPNAFAKGNYIAFFLSVDARARNLYRTNLWWDRTPIIWQLAANGHILKTGRLGDLHPPLLMHVAASDVPNADPRGKNDLRLTLSLLTTESIPAATMGFDPSIAIEYVFNPLTPPQPARLPDRTPAQSNPRQ